MQFEYYVLNEDFNKRKIEMFNIFRNHRVQTESERAVRKYLRAPSKYQYEFYDGRDTLYGFDALCETIRRIIMYEEWARCEYEIMVGGLFANSLDEFKKIDCYEQCKPNIPMITREIIHQYKQQLKEE